MDAPAKIRSMSILIPDGESWDAVKVLRCLDRQPEVTVHVLARTHLAPARFSRHCASCHLHASENDEDWIRVVKDLVQRLKIDSILPVTERGVEFAARNRKALSEFAAVAPLSDFELFTMARDKWSFYRYAVERGLPVPASILVGKAEGTNINLPDIDSVAYPALLKPTLAGGGFGIVKVEGPSDLQRAWNDERIMKGQQYMLQSYIPGVVLCLAIYSQAGEIVAFTLWKTLVRSRKRLYLSARAMEYVNDQKVIDLGRRLVSDMKWDGIANIDVLLDARDGTAKILDFNPQFGQSLLGSLLAGVNFPLLACLGANGMEYPDMQQRTAMRYVHPATQGKMLISRLIGKRLPVKLRWREGGLQFAVRDPLPEFVDIARVTVKRLKSRRNARR